MPKLMHKWIIRILLSCSLLVAALMGWVYSITYHPDPIEPVTVSCADETPEYNGQPLSIMSYNLQYFAGKGYVFYYDLPDNKGKDLRPTRKSLETTLQGIVDLIKQHDPDILLIQELHEGAKATDFEDQLVTLQRALGEQAYPCTADAFYWKADFVPHPAIMGSVGMKLATFSKYKMTNGKRHQLPLMPADPISQQFNLKRAILETQLESADGAISIMNTHLDAFAQGSNTMSKQVAYVKGLFDELDRQNTPWIIGGDFNLLVPGKRGRLQASQHYLYNDLSELAPIWGHYTSIPDTKDVNGANESLWFTHYPNDPDVKGPDRTIDYLFLSKHWKVKEKQVIQDTALALSDHMPVTATIKLKPDKQN